MPDMTFEPPSEEPLFSVDDPLTITVPGDPAAEPGTPEAGGTFLCLDRANPPVEDDVDPTSKPVSYLVETFRLQVIPDQREDFELALLAAFRANRILAPQLLEVGRKIADARTAAEKRATSRAVDRPTRGPQGSTH